MASWTWTGASGRKYTYDSYPINSTWSEAAVNYIFVKEDGNSATAPI